MLEYLKGVSMEINNTEEFGYSWLKDEVLSFYENDRKVTTIYNIFAVIAIIISCLGLFGISLFDIRQRYREIGIRKVNGAGMKDLYRLLFRKYFIVLPDIVEIEKTSDKINHPNSQYCSCHLFFRRNLP